MPCYYPIAAVQSYPGAPLQLFKREQKHLFRHLSGKHLEVPCGQCSGCRTRRTLEWAARATHENQLHKHSCSITLTYNDKHLPYHTLVHRHFVLFMKALRNELQRQGIPPPPPTGGEGRGGNLKTYTVQLARAINIAARAPHEAVARTLLATSTKIKFYMAGEYGELYGRPHYHALLFGVDFADKIYQQKTKSGEKIYTSATLQKLWPYGYSSIGNVTFNAAAYISRYIMKKRNGDGNKKEYEILDPDTGEIIHRKKEYNCMSRAPGIGKEWLEKYHSDVYTLDKVITRNGRQLRPPRYYDKHYKKLNKARLQHLKDMREREALAQAEHHTPERLAVQEEVANAKARFQTRNLE